MDFIQPQNRSLVSLGSLEDLSRADNPVRVIDGFVERFARLRCEGQLTQKYRSVRNLQCNEMMMRNSDAHVSQNRSERFVVFLVRQRPFAFE